MRWIDNDDDVVDDVDDVDEGERIFKATASSLEC